MWFDTFYSVGSLSLCTLFITLDQDVKMLSAFSSFDVISLKVNHMYFTVLLMISSVDVILVLLQPIKCYLMLESTHGHSYRVLCYSFGY
jgi:hypothetical protein